MVFIFTVTYQFQNKLTPQKKIHIYPKNGLNKNEFRFGPFPRPIIFGKPSRFPGGCVPPINRVDGSTDPGDPRLLYGAAVQLVTTLGNH